MYNEIEAEQENIRIQAAQEEFEELGWEIEPCNLEQGT